MKDVPDAVAGPGEVRIRVRAAGVNPHDLWTLRGVGHPAERIPMILGCEGAGVTDDGRRVLTHCVIGDPEAGGGDETLDPDREILSERRPGTFAEYVVVPERNAVPIPDGLTFEQAACLPVAFGTAYRMLRRGGVGAGSVVLVQGGAGGVASACSWIAKALGAKVYATARTPEKREYAAACGADVVLEDGARLPERVDVVVDTIGEATWKHSLRCLKPGGAIVLCGATTGGSPDPELHRVFYQQLRVIGSTACTLDELTDLLALVAEHGLPEHLISETFPLENIADAFARLESGDHLGKLVVSI